jgi:hypothetical protein
MALFIAAGKSCQMLWYDTSNKEINTNVSNKSAKPVNIMMLRQSQVYLVLERASHGGRKECAEE